MHGTAPDIGVFFIMIAVGEPGEPPFQDTAIAVRPNLNNNRVKLHVFNRVNNKISWLPLQDGQMPFTAWQPFSLAITCQLYGFEVAVNGRHVASYTHKLPIAQTMTVWMRRLKAVEKVEYY